jgi:NitT/TauT family transport system ATP-binding protein
MAGHGGLEIIIMPTETTATAQLSDLVPICARLPSATIDQLIGATRMISHAGGRVGHRRLAKALHFDDEQTAGTVAFLSRLGLVEVIGNEVALTAAGKDIASAAIPTRKRIFAELAVRLPVIREIVDFLAREAGRSLPRETLMNKIGAQSCPSDADLVFDHVVTWGRYAGLFSYDAATGEVRLS